MRTLAQTLLVLPIRFYQRCISPLLPPACRFVPTCSEYAVQAVLQHGACKGSVLAVWRILRCHPFSRGGYDPVPPSRHQSPLAQELLRSHYDG